MAFIEKKDPLVLNIKLTSKGRELLSRGSLNFKYFAIGDSEIDYDFNKTAGIVGLSATSLNILRPVDKNPSILSYITKDFSGDTLNKIDNVPSIPTTIENDVQSLGFFSINNNGEASFLTDTDLVKQPDAMVKLEFVTGGTMLKLFKAPTYQSNVNEPQENDLILIRWTKPNGENTTGYTINKNFPQPNLFYKIENIVSGSLSNNNLIVTVDRPLPNFNGSGSNIVAGALIYKNNISITNNNEYSTDFVEDSILTFLQNCQCPTITFPFWNMSIIFTEDIVGVGTDDKKYTNFKTKTYGGFISYIQNQAPVYNKLGVIHYTNSSPSNTYAEEFFYDINDSNRRPTIEIPLIMWHKSTGMTLGLKLQAADKVKYITGVTRSLNTSYRDLIDPWDNIVGKVFMDLKLFVIEDQELLFAMSYKSNRSWTLPNYNVDINANVTFGCPESDLDFSVTGVSPSTLSSSDGSITIFDIINNIGNFDDGDIILDVSTSGSTGTTQIFFNTIDGSKTITDLSAGDYIVRLIDLKSGDKYKSITLDLPSSNLVTYDEELTQSLLNSNFKIYGFGSPTTIRVYRDKSGFNSLGTFIGKGFIAVVPSGSTSLPTQSGTTDNHWKEIDEDNDSYVEFSNLIFKEPYTLYVRDVTGSTINDYVGSDSGGTLWKNYYAVGSPLIPNLAINSGSDNTGNYFVITDWFYAPSQKNPLVGVVEASIYDEDSVPLDWELLHDADTGTMNNPKLYYDQTGVNYKITVRERVGKIIIDEVTKNVST